MFSSKLVLFVYLFMFVCLFRIFLLISRFRFYFLSFYKRKREKKRRLMKKAIFWCQKNLALPGGGWWKIDIHGHESKRLCVCVNCLLCWFFFVLLLSLLFCRSVYGWWQKKNQLCSFFLFCFVLYKV